MKITLNKITTQKVVEPPDFIKWVIETTSLSVFVLIPFYLFIYWVDDIVTNTFEIRSLFLQKQ